MAKKVTKTKNTKVSSSLAKNDDGTIQITFQIPSNIIREEQDKAINEMAKNIELPGFRKGKAPKNKVLEETPKEKIIELILKNILPKILAEAFDQYKIKPAIYPKIELISAKEEEDWQIRASTCELPEINLGDYKKLIQNEFKVDKIWLPGKDNKLSETTKVKSLSKEEKEQRVIKAVLKIAQAKIPSILTEENVSISLSKLLERLEKLGLSLETYLGSIGKSADQLREDYRKQAREGILLELALNRIAEEENIHIEDQDIEEAIRQISAASPQTSGNLETPSQKAVIKTILKRRRALESLMQLL